VSARSTGADGGGRGEIFTPRRSSRAAFAARAKSRSNASPAPLAPPLFVCGGTHSSAGIRTVIGVTHGQFARRASGRPLRALSIAARRRLEPATGVGRVGLPSNRPVRQRPPARHPVRVGARAGRQRVDDSARYLRTCASRG